MSEESKDLDSTQGKEDGIPERPPLWIVWVKTVESQNIMVAICTSEAIANRYRKYLKAINDTEFEMHEKHKFALIWVEKTVANHLISIVY